MAKELLGQFDLAEEKRFLWPLERWFPNELKKKLLGLCSLKSTMAQQRSRITKLSEGDANTHFFHLHANHRRRCNFITQLKVGDDWIQSHDEISEALAVHFE